MTCIQGFILAVPTANKAAYIEMARAAWGLFREYGAVEAVECWGTDVPEGALTSFPMAVQRRPDETVVFSWIVWPDKATADACAAAMEGDPRWQDMPEMCFDGKRMVWGFFEPIFRDGSL